MSTAVVLTPMLGGGRSEALAAAVVGAVTGVVAIVGGRSPRMKPIVARVPGHASSLSQAVAAGLAGLAFTGTLRARLRDAPLMCASTLLAVATKAVGTNVLGPQLGVFAGALAVGAAGAVAGGRLRRSPLVFIVPGVLMLVPGSLGLTSVLQPLANQTVGGVTAAFDTLLTAGSIAYGLMIAAALLPRPLASLSVARGASPPDGSA